MLKVENKKDDVVGINQQLRRLEDTFGPCQVRIAMRHGQPPRIMAAGMQAGGKPRCPLAEQVTALEAAMGKTFYIVLRVAEGSSNITAVLLKNPIIDDPDDDDWDDGDSILPPPITIQPGGAIERPSYFG